MDTLEAIRKRRSVRSFQNKPIPREHLEQIVDAGRLAPTARNEQPWAFVVVTNRAALLTIGGMTDHGRFIADAAACVAVFCRNTKYYLEDGCAATENILVAASALGIDACWVAGDKKTYVGEIAVLLDVPDDFRLVSLIALGFGAGERKEYPKRELSRVLHWEKFQR